MNPVCLIFGHKSIATLKYHVCNRCKKRPKKGSKLRGDYVHDATVTKWRK